MKITQITGIDSLNTQAVAAAKLAAEAAHAPAAADKKPEHAVSAPASAGSAGGIDLHL